MGKDEFNMVDEYISRFQEDVQEILKKLRDIIKETVPEAEERISYQIPTYYLYGNLVHFAAYKNHIGFYPTPSAIEAFKDELYVYKTSKGAVQFPIIDPIPFELIKKIVEFRVKENIENAEKRKE